MPHKDPAKLRAYKRKYYAENREKLLAWQCEYRETHRETVRAKDRKYREENREKRRASARVSSRKYREANPEKRRVSDRKYREANPEKRRANGRNYYAANPEKRRARAHARRAKTLATKEDVEYIAVLCNDPCVYCGAPSEHIDHIVPLAGGGEGGWENLTSACAHCNLSKGAKPMLLWMSER